MPILPPAKFRTDLEPIQIQDEVKSETLDLEMLAKLLKIICTKESTVASIMENLPVLQKE